MKWRKELLSENIEGTPFSWKQALRQGNTGVYAEPTDTQFDNIIKQAKALIPVLELLENFKITSWLRTPEHNKAIGGAPSSMHLQGLATDLVPTEHSCEEAKAMIISSNVYPGRQELDTTNWVHLDLKNNVNFRGKK